MSKLRKNKKSSSLKSIRKTSGAIIPTVGKGLTKIGNDAFKTVPVVEKGVSSVYGTLASGFDLGIKGVKTVAKGVTKNIRKTKKSKKSKKHNTRKNK